MSLFNRTAGQKNLLITLPRNSSEFCRDDSFCSSFSDRQLSSMLINIRGNFFSRILHGWFIREELLSACTPLSVREGNKDKEMYELGVNYLLLASTQCSSLHCLGKIIVMTSPCLSLSPNKRTWNHVFQPCCVLFLLVQSYKLDCFLWIRQDCMLQELVTVIQDSSCSNLFLVSVNPPWLNRKCMACLQLGVHY